MLGIILELIDMVLNPVGFVLDVVRDGVVPVDGAVVYCKIGPVEHSGIYISRYGQIVHRNRNGDIELVPPSAFTFCNGDTIYVSCCDSVSVGSSWTANRALEYYQSPYWESYNIIGYNCHNLCAACVTGDADTPVFAFLMLVVELRLATDHNNWRMWKTEGGSYLF